MSLLPKVLLVEDDRYVSDTLAAALKNDYFIEVTSSGKTALDKSGSQDYDQIILDLNLPDISGLSVINQMRQRGVRAPILILSAETSVLSKVSLLDSGANDYLTKPFALGELKARLRVLSRNTRASQAFKDPLLEAYGIALDRLSMSVSRDGKLLKLRRKEFELLACLMENAGRVVPRQELIDKVWNGGEDIWTNTVDVHVNYLRQKLDKPFAVPLIHTVHGWGYKLDDMVVSAPKLKGVSYESFKR